MLLSGVTVEKHLVAREKQTGRDAIYLLCMCEERQLVMPIKLN